jgi:predicted  nucleic acid-binding Zn-ribbon protein
MNFEKIFHGMIGKDFIKAFNDNFNIADKNFLEILATLIYKVKSTDIKEIKLIDNVVSYTLEEEPLEGEDNRTWVPVDITKWGNIQGNIEDQLDLKEILDNKAALDTVTTMDNLLSTLNQQFGQLKDKVEINETKLNTNTGDIADLLEAMTEKVSSTNIKAIRLNNAIFQWSPDGRTWYEQQLNTTISWGSVTGDITTQEDLMKYFIDIDSKFTTLNGNITSINNTIDTLRTEIGNNKAALEAHLEDFASYKREVDNTVSEIRTEAEDAKTQAANVQSNLDTHLTDYANPHRISKDTIFLDQVDNTSDMNKPVSTIQKAYIDEQVSKVGSSIADKSGLVNAKGFISNIFVGPESLYNMTGSLDGMLALVLDDEYFTADVNLFSNQYTEYGLYKDGTLLTSTAETSNSKFYSGIPYGDFAFMIKVTVDGVEKSFDVELSYTITNNISIDELLASSQSEGSEE